jgi:hypothetical protein
MVNVIIGDLVDIWRKDQDNENANLSVCVYTSSSLFVILLMVSI